MILDGWGIKRGLPGDVFLHAETPNFDRLWRDYPHTSLVCSGERVGLPEGQMGNSEVGHMNIGAGRVIYQDLSRIDKAIEDESFFANPALMWAMTRAKQKGVAMHLMGLVSDGGVHSMNTHLYALLRMAKCAGLREVYIHCFTDGRDTSPKSAAGYIAELEEEIACAGVGAIATVCGRFYAMDRDKRWDRVEKAYRALVTGVGGSAADAASAVRESYRQGIYDEFIEPTMISADGWVKKGRIKKDDGIIFFNYRADRARELTHVFCDPRFEVFDRDILPKDIHFTCMTSYDETVAASVAFAPMLPVNTLGRTLAGKGLRQLRIAETEKYAHVTFFFNGGVEGAEIGEDRILIPSPKVKTYDLQPEMSAYLITDAVTEQIEAGIYDAVIINYANPDMVGHTGNLSAAVRAVEVVDECLGAVERAVRLSGGAMIITADHGNVEEMLDRDGYALTQHSMSDVPFILVSDEYRHASLAENGSLQNIAATFLQLLTIKRPGQMTGKSLIMHEGGYFDQMNLEFE